MVDSPNELDRYFKQMLRANHKIAIQFELYMQISSASFLSLSPSSFVVDWTHATRTQYTTQPMTHRICGQ